MLLAVAFHFVTKAACNEQKAVCREWQMSAHPSPPFRKVSHQVKIG